MDGLGNISFDGKVLRTPIYIKMDAHDQLLLAEGVCSQLGIVEYHKDVWPGTKVNMEAIKAHELKAIDAPLLSVKQVRMSREATIPAGKAVIIPVTIEGIKSQNGPLLLEKFSDDFEGTGLEMERSLFQPTENGETTLTIFYTSRFTEKIPKDTVIGEATDVQAVCQSPMVKADDKDTAFTVAIKQANCNQTTDAARIQQRKKVLLLSNDNAQVCELLGDHHHVFALEDKERGETNLVQLEIEIGNSPPARQHPRRVPFAAREEIARQLKKMQEMSVIQPSKSPWSSPVVLVRKKDGSHQFCVDYHKLHY